jgi:general secretion pathway protein J
MKARRVSHPAAGFTLLEAMLSVALMTAIVAALAMVTAQWLPNWRHGFADLQRADLLSLGLERIAADISAAEYVTPNNATPELLFEGNELSVIFVRSAFGPDSQPHLEVVRIAETVDDRGFAVVRTRARFAPLAPGASVATGYVFSDPVVLARAPFRVSFAYSGPGQTWLNSWVPAKRLPGAVRIAVRDAQSDQLLAASTAVTMKITAAGIHTPTSDDAATDPDETTQQDDPSQAKTSGSPGQASER